MQTYSHFIITAVLNRNLQKRTAAAPAQARPARLPPLHSRALLWGSVLPDIPLILITLGAMAVDWMNGTRWQPGSAGDSSTVGRLFRDLFFHDPWVITAHNLFHAPLLVAAYVGAGYWLWRRGGRGQHWGALIFWVGIACAIHTAIDIPVHHDDGPLLFFPFNWDLRFYSPVSYWDGSRFGTQFALAEHLLVLLSLIWLARDGWLRRRADRPEGGTQPAEGD